VKGAYANATERQLKLGLIKVSAILVSGFLLLAAVVVWLTSQRGIVPGIFTSALLLSFSFNFLANGVLAVLGTIDWFEARKAKRNV
jgi:hypothetical protein